MCCCAWYYMYVAFCASAKHFWNMYRKTHLSPVLWPERSWFDIKWRSQDVEVIMNVLNPAVAHFVILMISIVLYFVLCLILCCFLCFWKTFLKYVSKDPFVTCVLPHRSAFDKKLTSSPRYRQCNVKHN